ncbi:MAG: hypothetical protein JNL50_07630 [Phycisphaerae bacterium]|nr:hypothetical protein [Phycisphaerae bacterium]
MTARTALLGAVLAAAAVRAQTVSMVSSPHDLSAGSAANIRAASEDQVCIFCHTTHNASPIAPLWNRAVSPQAYAVYTSRSLDARPGQPTGDSKLCLSCHDGTIALGSVLNRGLTLGDVATPIQMSGGVTTMPHGPGNIGTDLRDDHPISFRYDSALAGKDGRLRDPAGLPHQIKLDPNRELQCTTCHDAHNNAFGKFLVMRNTNSELCVSCHAIADTDIQGHARCIDCHQSHTAPSGPHLLKQRTATRTCTSCHDGSHPGAVDIASDITKISAHDTSGVGNPDAALQSQSSCTSCHDPHTMRRGTGARSTGTGPRTGSLGRLGQISGVNASGSPVRVATAEQEVCFKCHADGNTVPPIVPRKISNNNTRLQFSPGAVSMHPVGTPGRASQVPSLRPGWSASSTMRCGDCHGSDAGAPAGIHGSNNPGLLVAAYETRDFTGESAATYALCYQCHDRASILDNRSFPGHKLHIVDKQTPCAACHDAHGIPSGQGRLANNSHLINFATAIVFPDRATGKLEYRDTGGFTGECFLSCHGVDHSPKRYPVGP